MNNFKIEDRIKTIIMYSCIIHVWGKKSASPECFFHLRPHPKLFRSMRDVSLS